MLTTGRVRFHSFSDGMSASGFTTMREGVSDLGLYANAIALLAIFAVIWLVRFYWRKAKLDDDPLQIRLGQLILELVGNGADGPAIALFDASVTNVLVHVTMTRDKDYSTRLAHALSLVRGQMTNLGYQRARQIVRGYLVGVRP